MPASNNLYSGVLEDAEVQPTLTGGVWHPKLFDARDDIQKKTILHSHGGAYVSGDCRHANTAFGVVSGDFASSHIVIALLRYFHDNEEVLPLPSVAQFWSPWVDLETDPKSFDQNQKNKTDFVTSAMMTGGIESFKPSSMRISNPYLTPRDSPFPSPVPIFVQLGGGEVLYDVGAKLVENMNKVQGNEVELYESQHAPHAILLCGDILGFQKEAIAAANAAERFLKAQGVSASS